MPLLILLLVAAVFGYWLAKSRYHETIDQAADKAVTTSRSWTDGAINWIQGSIGKGKENPATSKPEPEVASDEASPVPAAQEATPAEKRPSRRKATQA